MKNNKPIRVKITFIILFFIGVSLFFNIIFLLLKTNGESFSKKYISFIKKNNNELNTFFYELDSVKQNTDVFYIQYHLNMNELYVKDLNEKNRLFFIENENRIKELLSKYYIREIQYIPKNKGVISVYFQKSTRFGITPNNFSMFFNIENDSHISYYFLKEKDTINFKRMSLEQE